MSSRNAVFQFLAMVLYVLAQVLLARHFTLGSMGFCFLYVGFLLMVPFETGPILLMLIGFVTGFAVDIFYDTLGINAIASLVVMALRPWWVGLLTPQGGIELGMTPSVKMMGFTWFARYALFLIFIHHLVLFFLEAFSARHFFLTLGKATFSTLFTFLVVVILQYSLYRQRRAL